MPKALWNGTVIAETDRHELVEGNVYFPPDTVKAEYLKPSSTHTVCGWKGTASYYTVVVDGKENRDARGGQHQGPHRVLARRDGGEVGRAEKSSRV
jgi:uncharacterized protein (DUF427 family)